MAPAPDARVRALQQRRVGVFDFAYSEEQARAVSVHSAAIVEALRKVYKADGLADELQPMAGAGQ